MIIPSISGLSYAPTLAFIFEKPPVPTVPSEWIKASYKCYKIASPIWNPPVIKVSECREIMGEAIVNSILGKDVKSACNLAAKKINDLIK